MQLLAPYMMWGAAAVSIPIALHFFYRARYRPLPWGPMRFLKEAIEQTSRRLRFQEWVLLALRCLALLLLAFALARPASDALKAGSRGGAIDAVFVLDTSYSMDARDGDKTRLERARAAAAAVLDTLPKGSSVQVVTCADRAALLGPRDRFNLDEARQLVANKVKVTSLSSDLFPGLTEALAVVKTESPRPKEVYVFSDLQEDALNRQQGAVRGRCEEIKKLANLVFVRCGAPGRAVPNVAVADVSWKTEIPHTKTSVPFVVSLRNTGAEPVKGVKVSLALDGKAVEKDEVQIDQIDPGQTYPVTLTAGLSRPGVGVVSVAVKGDDLPGDNVLYKTILVRDKVRILLVDGSPKPENPTGSGDHFVRTALNPGKVADYYIDTETVSAAEAGTKDLDGKEIVYLLNAPIRGSDPTAGLSAEFLGELNRFVRAGGGLVISGGDLVDPEAYNRALGSGGAKLLPFDLKKEGHAATEAAPLHPAADQVDEASFLGPFRKSPYAEALQRVSITRMLDATGPGGGRVLARTTGGFPYVVSKPADAGEVILVAGALDEQWGNFSADPGSFHVPLAVFTVTHLTGRRVAGGTETAGTPVVYQAPADLGTAFDLVAPAPPDEKFRPRTKLTAGEPDRSGRRAVTGTDTARAGVYHIVPAGKGDDVGPVFAVNPDPRDGQSLAAPADREVAEWLGFSPAIVQAGAGTETAVNDLRTRSEWTEWVLLVLLVLLIGESVWAWRCGQAR
jgi:hypothetical protein